MDDPATADVAGVTGAEVTVGGAEVGCMHKRQRVKISQEW